jgi:hypothetical protein
MSSLIARRLPVQKDDEIKTKILEHCPEEKVKDPE